MAYTKLFNSIVTSTIWSEDDQTRIVWITMLALADKNGEVQGSVPGLARIAGVSVDACRAAIGKFLSPDPDSRTRDDEGRRIEEIDGGWHLINHRKYREMASDADRAEKAAIRQARHREKLKRNVTPESRLSHAPVTAESRQNSQADTDTDTKADSKADSDSKTPLTESAPPPSVDQDLKLEPPLAKVRKPKPSPPDSRRQEFLNIFREYFEQGIGETWAGPDAADNAQLKRLFTRHPEMTPDEWREYLLYIHHESQKEYAPNLLRDCGTLALVCSKWDRIKIYSARK